MFWLPFIFNKMYVNTNIQILVQEFTAHGILVKVHKKGIKPDKSMKNTYNPLEK